jgi:hypothetical protein
MSVMGISLEKRGSEISIGEAADVEKLPNAREVECRSEHPPW